MKPIDLNEEEHPWPAPNNGQLVQLFEFAASDFQYPERHWAYMAGHFTAEQLRYIADFMESGKATWREGEDEDWRNPA